MTNNSSVGAIELSSIGVGYQVQDALMKAANTTLIIARTVCSGKYLIVFSGKVGDVESAMETALAVGGTSVIDKLVVANVHPALFPAMAQSVALSPEEIGALGVVETFSAVSAMVAADVITEIRAKNPDAKFWVHPEAPREVVDLSDGYGSTTKLLQVVADAAPGSTLAIGTEWKLVDRMRRQNSDKTILYPGATPSVCEDMSKSTLEKVAIALRAWRDGDLDLALEICDDCIATVAAKNPRFAGLRKMIVRRKALRRVLRYAAAIAAVALAYMAALPPLLSAARPKPLPDAAKVFFRPAAAAYARPSGFAVRALRGYASLFDVAASEFAAATVSSGLAAAEAVPDDASRIRQPGELASIIARHEAAIAAVKDAYEAKVAEWPEKYLADLNELLVKCREQGDFFGVQDVGQEIDRFSASGEWVPYEGTCDPLAELQRRHAQAVRAYGEERDESLRKAVAATLDELENLTRRFVKDGDMESASAVHAKIDELSAAEQPQQNPH